MGARDPAGITSLFDQRNETGLGVCVAFVNGCGNLCDDSDWIRSGPFASLWSRIKRDGPGDRDHAGDRGDRIVGGQNFVLTLGTVSPPALGHRKSLRCRRWLALAARRRGGQSDSKGCAFALAFALRANAAAMHFDNCFTDGETETETFTPHFQLLEGSENFLEKFRFNSNTVVGHFNRDRIWRAVVRAN